MGRALSLFLLLAGSSCFWLLSALLTGYPATGWSGLTLIYGRADTCKYTMQTLPQCNTSRLIDARVVTKGKSTKKCFLYCMSNNGDNHRASHPSGVVKKMSYVHVAHVIKRNWNMRSIPRGHMIPGFFSLSSSFLLKVWNDRTYLAVKATLAAFRVGYVFLLGRFGQSNSSLIRENRC